MVETLFELELCPFCAYAANQPRYFKNEPAGLGIECSNKMCPCGIYGYSDIRKLVKCWNTRPDKLYMLKGDKIMEYYKLKCEDASNLGGPMGTESTSLMFVNAFSTEEKAKNYVRDWCAERNISIPYHSSKWNNYNYGIVMDSGPFIFTITKDEIL